MQHLSDMDLGISERLHSSCHSQEVPGCIFLECEIQVIIKVVWKCWASTITVGSVETDKRRGKCFRSCLNRELTINVCVSIYKSFACITSEYFCKKQMSLITV